MSPVVVRALTPERTKRCSAREGSFLQSCITVGSKIYSGTNEIQRNIIAKWLGL